MQVTDHPFRNVFILRPILAKFYLMQISLTKSFITKAKLIMHM